jgi:cytoskeletal protein CcmA (bactofilin family)
MAKTNEIDPNVVNKITIGTSITGDVMSNGDIRIDGTLKGNLITKGKVVVGNEGLISGEIECKNADISGKVEGKIKVAELISLSKSAKITGEITTNRLAIEPGAVFSGTCNMDSGSSSTAYSAPSTASSSNDEKRK